MPLNKAKGDMYNWVTHTWNPIKGHCYHNCSYCYMHTLQKRFKQLDHPIRLDEKEMRVSLGKGKTIFVGSSTDILAENIPEKWIRAVLEHIAKYPENKYLFQSKNPERFLSFLQFAKKSTGMIETTPRIPEGSMLCTTVETNRWMPEIMQNSPRPHERLRAIAAFNNEMFERYITIEPIMDFDLNTFLRWIEYTNPKQVNIGSDTGRNKLPEPSSDKIKSLINELQKITSVKQKKNLSRILGK